jgi:hypothetical protein
VKRLCLKLRRDADVCRQQSTRDYNLAYAHLRRPTSLTRVFLEPLYTARDPPLASLDELVAGIRALAHQDFQSPTVERALRKAAVYYQARAPPYLAEHPPTSGTWWYGTDPPPPTPRAPET